jgi:hypothetical protein
MATLRGGFARGVRNAAIAALCTIPLVRRRIAYQMAELSYR